MNERFLHIAFNWSGESKIAEVKPIFDSATDWIQYAPNCWIVWTGHTPQSWMDAVKPYLDEGDHVFICAIDITVRQGWLPKTIWDWINKQRI